MAIMRASLFLATLAIAGALVPAAAGAETIDRSVAVPARAKVLQIEAGGGDVTLVPGGGDAVSVRIERSGGGAAPPVQSSSTGNRVMVQIGGAGGPSMIPFAAASSMKYTIGFPSRLRLDVRTSSGNVSVAGTSSGVEIYADGGSISVDSARAGVTAESGHGSVTATGIQGAVDLASDSGDVTATLVKGWTGSQIRMQSGSGSIRLAVPAGFRGRFDATGGSGGVHNAAGGSNAKSPLVWLYAPSGAVYVTIAP